MQMVLDSLRKANIYDKAIIIVQGDHGSRIAIHKPFLENKKELTQQDFKDYYETLFAVKIPGQSAQYDTQLIVIQTLLEKTTTTIISQKVDYDKGGLRRTTRLIHPTLKYFFVGWHGNGVLP